MPALRVWGSKFSARGLISATRSVRHPSPLRNNQAKFRNPAFSTLSAHLSFQGLRFQRMPSICNFETSIISIHNGQLLRFPEYDIHLRPSSHSTTLTTNSSKDVPSASEKAVNGNDSGTSTCTCYVPSTPNQKFQVMVSNNSPTDAGISVFVDGEWVYTGLSYPPLYKAISFSGRLIDPNTVQEMRFMELDTTCNPRPSGNI